MPAVRTAKLLPVRTYVRRQVVFGLAAVLMLAATLAVGTVGYHSFEPLSWIDALYSASMILSGMGPPMEIKTEGAKLFASGYALFCGVVLLTSASVAISPTFARIMHSMHLEAESRAGAE